jgi:rod shape-determining protein MreB and related proteins
MFSSITRFARTGASLFAKRPFVGIDLGTTETLMFIDDGPIWKQPTILLKDTATKRITGFGEEAYPYWECTADGMETSLPMKDGVIYDHNEVSEYIRLMIRAYKKLHNITFTAWPYILVGTPTEVSPASEEILERAVLQTKETTNVGFIDQALSAGIGAGADVESATGCTIVDIGGGTLCIAVISALGHVPNGKHSIKDAGMAMNQAIIDAVSKKYNLDIGNPTAEKLKKKIGSAIQLNGNSPEPEPIWGRSRVRRDQNVKITSDFVHKAINSVIERQMKAISDTLDAVRPEQSEKIYTKGIWLAGGSAQLANYVPRIYQDVRQMTAEVAKDPQEAVANGMKRVMADASMYKKVVRHRSGVVHFS